MPLLVKSPVTMATGSSPVCSVAQRRVEHSPLTVAAQDVNLIVAAVEHRQVGDRPSVEQSNRHGHGRVVGLDLRRTVVLSHIGKPHPARKVSWDENGSVFEFTRMVTSPVI